MILPRFEYRSPQSVAELMDLLTESEATRKRVSLLAGGTDLMPQLKRGEVQIDLVVSLKGLGGFSGVKLQGSGSDRSILIGSLTRVADLAQDPLIREHLSDLSQAAGQVASYPIRSRATVGGNLLANNRCKYFNQESTNRICHDPCFKAGGEVCHLIPNSTRDKHPVCRARFISDLAPLLILYGAEVVLQTPNGVLVKPLSEIYSDEGLENKKSTTFLSEVRVPLKSAKEFRWSYKKLRIRQTLDFPSAGAAMAVRGEDGARELQLCLTGVETHPVRLKFEESKLGDQFLSEIEKGTRKSITPIKQDFFSPKYRREIIFIWVQEFLDGPC